MPQDEAEEELLRRFNEVTKLRDEADDALWAHFEPLVVEAEKQGPGAVDLIFKRLPESSTRFRLWMAYARKA